MTMTREQQHTFLFTVAGVRFYEDGTYGDEAPMWAKYKESWYKTDWWDKPSEDEVVDWLDGLGLEGD